MFANLNKYKLMYIINKYINFFFQNWHTSIIFGKKKDNPHTTRKKTAKTQISNTDSLCPVRYITSIYNRPPPILPFGSSQVGTPFPKVMHLFKKIYAQGYSSNFLVFYRSQVGGTNILSLVYCRDYVGNYVNL